MKVFYFDCETSGTNPNRNDILQMAGLIEIDGQVIDSFKLHCQPFDYGTIEQGALDCNGLTIEQIKTFPTPQETYSELLKILGNHVNKYDRTDKFYLAGQKIGFDADFLQAFFEKNNDKYFGSWVNRRYIDLLALTRILNYVGVLKTENDKLGTLAEMFGVSLDAHDALEDIKATREILKIMIGKYIKHDAV